MPETIKLPRRKTVPQLTNGNGGGEHQKSASPSKPKAPQRKQYYASVFPGKVLPLPSEFGSKMIALEKLLHIPIWTIIHQGKCPDCGGGAEIEHNLFKAFQAEIRNIPQGEPIGLLIESPGGDTHSAYRLGRLLQRRSKNQLTVIVPQYAKSAATLLALSASRLIVAENAELGPLDVQMFDSQKEAFASALDAVQSLERLNAVALMAIAQTMGMVCQGTGKRTDIILPHVMSYVAQFFRPLLEKIDTVDYTRQSRELKVAEEYAIRLMGKNVAPQLAQKIASELVSNYPTHGFVIDREEVSGSGQRKGLGLKVESLQRSVRHRFESIVADLIPYLDELDIIGRVIHI